MRKLGGILMIHRVDMGNGNCVSPLYFQREMAISWSDLVGVIDCLLENGLTWGSIAECCSSPDSFFCLTFDDGFCEHLDVARRLESRFLPPKKSLIFSVSVGNSIRRNFFSGMDVIYSLIDNGFMRDVVEYFCLSQDASIQDIKEKYVRLSPSNLEQFYSCFEKNIEVGGLFLSAVELCDLAQYGIIASHGITHRDMTCSVVESKNEILDSKLMLEDIIGSSVDYFCIPEGRTNAELNFYCKEVGYLQMLGISKHIDSFCVGRIAV